MTERLARITPDDMTGEQAEIYAKFTGGKRYDQVATQLAVFGVEPPAGAR
jgi:hypothetical protein